MISQTAEYALRATVLLGSRAGRPCPTAQLAEEIDAPPSYLAKVLSDLSRAGIVDSQRGPHGGHTLARDPAELTILDVITAVGAMIRIPDCPLGRPRHTSGLCPLHRRLDDVMAAAEQALELATIGELIEEPNLLCSLPCIAEPSAELEP